MKNLLLVLVVGFTASVTQASAGGHWACTTSTLKLFTFDDQNGISHFHVVDSNFDAKELDQAFVAVNEFTVIAKNVVDTRAQETLDYTIIINRGAHRATVLSQWSTNDSVDSETVVCSVK